MLGFPGGSDSKESFSNAGDLGSLPGSGRSPGEVNGYPLQHSCLENGAGAAICICLAAMCKRQGRGAWQATDHGVTKSQTRLSDWYSPLRILYVLTHVILRTMRQIPLITPFDRWGNQSLRAFIWFRKGRRVPVCPFKNFALEHLNESEWVNLSLHHIFIADCLLLLVQHLKHGFIH